MKVEIYPRAEEDIIRQFRYYLVSQDAPAVAFRVREAVVESIGQLKPYPGMGALFQGSILGLRSWQVKGLKPIRVYYVHAPDCLRVVRVLHGKRNLRQILRQEKLPPSNTSGLGFRL